MFTHLPQINSLRVFDSAARLNSFKAAAAELNVTPTAVSHQIRALEKKLGTLLFKRKTRLIILTPEGEKLARVVSHSLLQISDVLEEISDNQSVLTVSTTTSFAAQWLVPKLESFHLRHPEIRVVVKTGESLDDLQKDKRIDLAIRYGQFDAQNEYATKLITEQFGMYATKEYLQGLPNIEDAILIETAWKNRELQPITWTHYFNNKNVGKEKLKIRSYEQEHYVIQAALAGQGVALVSSLLIQTALRQKWLEKHPGGESIEGLTYYMLTSSAHVKNRKVVFFREWLLDELVKQ